MTYLDRMDDQIDLRANTDASEMLIMLAKAGGRLHHDQMAQEMSIERMRVGYLRLKRENVIKYNPTTKIFEFTREKKG